MSSPVQLDSLVANEVRVLLGPDEVHGIFNVRNLFTYATDANGQRVKPSIEVSKMVQRDPNLAFNQWLRETLDARDNDTRVTRQLVVLAVDDGIETRRWTIHNAVIQAVRYSDFDSGSSEMVEEIFTIGYDDITDEFLTE